VVQGISGKTLIQHLKEMEADGIVTRPNFKDVPPRVGYALTPFGESRSVALTPLCKWGMRFMTEQNLMRQASGRQHPFDRLLCPVVRGTMQEHSRAALLDCLLDKCPSPVCDGGAWLLIHVAGLKCKWFAGC
jgi:HxlR-like helix-turn-helix